MQKYAGFMTITQANAKSQLLDIEPGNQKKADLIIAIQKAEGRTPCFGAIQNGCPDSECRWAWDCAKTAIGATAA
jgi:hypothetical protein